MTIDSAKQLRDWGRSLEEALGISVMTADDRGMMLKTKGGNLFGVAPVPGLPGLVFTGVIGVANEHTSTQTLCSLLAINLNATLSAMGYVGLDAATREILYRLMWMPRDEGWTEQAFAAVLAAFSEHVDQLAKALANGELEKLAAVAPAGGSREQPLNPNFTNMA
ncbi:type III secretion system chaperone [Bordetella sp. 02P26C-1]|uniref:type III secretion system chaperone n=1 Tax=Bordetella sp. 02P26C-1 TaxID=2683195 RepID=UPI0013546B15|nr:type III secretion system chaperone [Bordetella sp. 02P26C-1]MVW80499.1 hypothetical protein [Bordetella sp. 02P26C-1]